MSFARRMRWVAGAALTTALAFGVPTAASAASSTPVWGAPEPYVSTGTPEFLSIACTGVGDCVAVGEEEFATNEYRAVVAAEAGGVWGPTAPVDMNELSSKPSKSMTAGLYSVSCTSATACTAVGDYKNSSEETLPIVVAITVSRAEAAGVASAVTLPDPHATGGSQLAALDGVSCDVARDCTAVGYYEAASAIAPMTAVQIAGEWTATEVVDRPSGAPTNETAALTAISCPASGACEAVGNYENAKDLYPWALEVSDGHAGTGKNVELRGKFVATEQSAIPTEGLGTIGLDTISCPSTGVCTAAGEYPVSGEDVAFAAFALPIASGVPGAATQLSIAAADKQPESYEFVKAIWCSDASDCALAGTFGSISNATRTAIVASESAGEWSPLAPLPNSELTRTTGMTCATAGHCVAAVVAEASGGEVEPFFADSLPALSLSTTSLPAATVGEPYDATLAAAGGSGAYSWAVSSGSLPPGLSLNAATGVISGTPTTAGQSSFVATANDAGPPAQTASTELSVTVAPGPVAPAPAPTPTPTPKVSVEKVTTHGGKATIVLSCSGAPCAGKLKLTGVEHLKGTKATALIAKKHKKTKASKKTITLASGSYAIDAGGKQSVTLTLSGAASKLLAKLHSISADLDVTPLGATSPSEVTKLKFHYTAKPKKHQKLTPHKKK